MLSTDEHLTFTCCLKGKNVQSFATMQLFNQFLKRSGKLNLLGANNLVCRSLVDINSTGAGVLIPLLCASLSDNSSVKCEPHYFAISRP